MSKKQSFASKQEEALLRMEAMIEELVQKKRALSKYINQIRLARTALKRMPLGLGLSDSGEISIPGVPGEVLAAEVGPPHQSSGRETKFQKIAEYLKSKGNRPQIIKDIVAATGIDRGTVSAVLYRLNPNDFEWEGGPGTGRRYAVRLADRLTLGQSVKVDVVRRK